MRAIALVSCVFVFPITAILAQVPRTPQVSESPSAQAGTVLVTGSNRGLGLEFARQYAARGWTVIATARSPETATELKDLASTSTQVKVEKLDLLDRPGIKDASL